MLSGLTSIIERANKEGGKCYASLYELTDDELIKELIMSLKDAEIVLSNNGTGDDAVPTMPAMPRPAEALSGKPLVSALHAEGPDRPQQVHRLRRADNEPKAVLTGSTNWTATGLCTQSNNCIIVDRPSLRRFTCAYWNDLKRDAEEAKIPPTPAPMKSIQGAKLRQDDARSRAPVIPIAGGPTAHVWFSPNAPSLVKTTSKVPPGSSATLFGSARRPSRP